MYFCFTNAIASSSLNFALLTLDTKMSLFCHKMKKGFEKWNNYKKSLIEEIVIEVYLQKSVEVPNFEEKKVVQNDIKKGFKIWHNYKKSLIEEMVDEVYVQKSIGMSIF